MMRFLSALVAILMTLPLLGQGEGNEFSTLKGELKIADTLGGEAVARRVALGWAKLAPGIKISIETITLLEAIERGGFDVILYRVNPLEDHVLEPGGEKSLYAVESALVFAHEKNPRNSISMAELSDIFSGEIDTWLDITGEGYSIRRYAVVRPAAGEAVFRELVMGQLELTESLRRTVSAVETAANCGGSEYAIGVAGYIAELPENVKLLSVENVTPSLENIASGEYPLTLRRMAALESGSDLGALFIAYLTSEQVKGIFAEFDLPPAAAVEKDEK